MGNGMKLGNEEGKRKGLKVKKKKKGNVNEHKHGR